MNLKWLKSIYQLFRYSHSTIKQVYQITKIGVSNSDYRIVVSLKSIDTPHLFRRAVLWHIRHQKKGFYVAIDLG